MKGDFEGTNTPQTEQTESNTERVERTQKMMLSRRRFGQVAGATTVAALGLSGATAAEASDELNYGTELVQDPKLESTVTVAETDLEEMNELDYLDDTGDPASLEDDGAQLAERDEEDEINNRVTLRADRFYTEEYTQWPRDETYEDEDGDTQDLNWNDDQHWSTDTSGSTGDLTVTTDETPSGADGLRVQADGQEGGDTATATFDDVSSDDPERAYLQVVANVDSLPADTTAYIRVHDSADNSISVAIDPDGESDADDIIATAQGSGQVYQRQIGDFDGGTDLEDIDQVEIEVVDSDIDLLLAGFNLDRTSRWEFGLREYLDEDDEIDTETVRKPSGEFNITSVDTLGDVFSDATIADISYELEYPASNVPEDQLDFEFESADQRTYDQRFKKIVGWDLESGYDLTYDDTKLTDEVLLPDERYITVEFASDVEDIPDVDDRDDVEWTDRTGDYSREGDDLTLSEAVSADEKIAIHFDYQVWDDEQDEMTDVAVAGGPTGAGGRGGITGFIFSLPGMALTALGSIWGIRRFVNR